MKEAMTLNKLMKKNKPTDQADDSSKVKHDKKYSDVVNNDKANK